MPSKCKNCGSRIGFFTARPASGEILACPNCSAELRYFGYEKVTHSIMMSAFFVFFIVSRLNDGDMGWPFVVVALSCLTLIVFIGRCFERFEYAETNTDLEKEDSPESSK